MAADLHVHVADRTIEPMLRRFFSNTLGSKYFNPRTGFDNEAFDVVGNTPSVWIGEVSWLKAVLCEDSDTFVPDPVAAVCEVVGEDLPLVDDEFISRIDKALSAVNDTQYSVEDGSRVCDFLREHKGKHAFTVSW